MHITLKVYISIFIAMVCWSLSFIWYKEAYVYFGPMTVIFLRLLISSILLSIVCLITGKLKIAKRDFKLFAAIAFFEPFLYFIGESFGMQRVSSVTASVIIATIPVFTALAASVLYNEKLRWLNKTGIFISFAGVSMVVLTKTGAFDASISGVLLMLLAVFSAIGYGFMLKKLISAYSTITIITIQNITGSILFAPLFLNFEWHSFIANASVNAMLPVINLAVFGSSVAFILFAFSVRHIGISKANTFTNLIPVLTSVFAYFMLNEAFTSMKIAGIVTVVFGLFLSQYNHNMFEKIKGPFFIKKP